MSATLNKNYVKFYQFCPLWMASRSTILRALEPQKLDIGKNLNRGYSRMDVARKFTRNPKIKQKSSAQGQN